MFFEDHMESILSVAWRLTGFLAFGWILIAVLRRSNPGWTVAVTRAMLIGCLTIPVLVCLLPTAGLRVLPAVASDDVELPSTAAVPQRNLEDSVIAPAVSPGTIDLEAADTVPANSIEDSASKRSTRSVSGHASSRKEVVPIDLPSADLAAAKPPLSEWNPAPNVPAGIRTAGRRVPWSLLPPVIWITVSVLLMYRLAARMRRTRRILRASRSGGSDIVTAVEELSQKFFLRDIADIRLSDDIGGPCTAGWRSPVVLLPSAWVESMSRRDLRIILTHELMHVAGKDPFWDLLVRIASALWWFHPLVWRMATTHRLACEHACDAIAAQTAGGFADYRRLLAGWALRVQSGAVDAMTTFAMADRTLLHRRLRWLNHPANGGPIRRRSRLVFAGMTIACLAVTASLTLATRSPMSSAPSPSAAVVPTSADGNLGAADAASVFSADEEATGTVSESSEEEGNTHVVHVVDADGNPVPGAQVGFGPWHDDAGKLHLRALFNLPTTDADGKVEIEFPDTAKRAHITVYVEGFAKYGKDFALTRRSRIETTLIRGDTIRVLAVTEGGEPLPDAYPLLEKSRIWGREFKQLGEGLFESPAVNKERTVMRVAAANGRDSMLFSDLIDINDPDVRNEDGTIRAVLRPGVRLEGRLDDSVPRPITGGYVDLWIYEGKEHTISRHLEWEDTTHINKDGTFVFDSLPPGAHAQIFAIGDGFQAADLTRDEYVAYLNRHNAGSATLAKEPLERGIGPHLVPLTGEVARITVPCRQPTSADIKVVDPGGHPISGATVSFNPNGSFVGGELFIPATSNSTRRMVEGAGFVSLSSVFSWRESAHEWATRNYLSVRTDKDGIARIRNLPGSRPESFEVERAGYLMPAHPTSVDGESRYAILDMSPGQTQQITITMERPVPRVIRGVTVLQSNGDPVEDVTVAVTELSFADTPNAWETWSVPRFGATVRSQTNRNGDVELLVPEQVGGRNVSALRVLVRGSYRDNDLWTNHTITLPLRDDGGVVRLTDHDPASDRRPRLTMADYVPASAISEASKAALLNKLLNAPLLATLRQLLISQGYDELEPIAFAENRAVRHDSPVILVPLEDAGRVVVLCKVRPKDASWQSKPEHGFAPEAAFVFDAQTALLKRVVGGSTSADGKYVDIMFCNMGGTDDYFVSTSAFEDVAPFRHIAWWYRIGAEGGPSLTYRNYANSTSWSGQDVPGDPPAEFAYTEHHLPGREIERDQPGVTPAGALAGRQIFWDASLRKFIGPATQSFDGQPLYEVVLEESSEFQPLDPGQDDIVAGGGRRDYEYWHWWRVTAPNGKRTAARLLLVSGSADEEIVDKVLFEHPLAAGTVHGLQLQVDPLNQGPERSFLRIRVNCGDEGEQGVGIPRIEMDDSASVDGQAVAFSDAKSVTLLNRPTIDSPQRLVWRVESE